MLNQPLALTAASIGAHFHAHRTRVLTEPRSQPGKAGQSLECATQPGSALSRLCLPNLGALPLLLVRNRLQGREPGPWGLYSLYSLEGPLPGTSAQGPPHSEPPAPSLHSYSSRAAGSAGPCKIVGLHGCHLLKTH